MDCLWEEEREEGKNCVKGGQRVLSFRRWPRNFLVAPRVSSALQILIRLGQFRRSSTVVVNIISGERKHVRQSSVQRARRADELIVNVYID